MEKFIEVCSTICFCEFLVYYTTSTRTWLVNLIRLPNLYYTSIPMLLCSLQRQFYYHTSYLSYWWQHHSSCWRPNSPTFPIMQSILPPTEKQSLLYSNIMCPCLLAIHQSVASSFQWSFLHLASTSMQPFAATIACTDHKLMICTICLASVLCDSTTQIQQQYIIKSLDISLHSFISSTYFHHHL